MGGSLSKEKVAEMATTKDETYVPPLGPANPVRSLALPCQLQPYLALWPLRTLSRPNTCAMYLNTCPLKHQSLLDVWVHVSTYFAGKRANCDVLR